MNLSAAFFVPLLGDVVLKNLAFMINGTPKVIRLAANLHKHLIEMPAPLSVPAHPIDALPLDVGGEQRPKSILPEPHRLMADIDAPLDQQILDVAQVQRETAHTSSLQDE